MIEATSPAQMIRSAATALLISTTLITPATVFAWGADGHRVTGHVAAELLTSRTRMRLNDLADTSVSLRFPSALARNNKPPTLLRNQSRKPTLACEPVVSALTEVARLLPPGRCVT